MRGKAAVVSLIGLFIVAFVALPSTSYAQSPRERDVNTSQLLDTFIQVDNSSTATWEIALPNNDYWVSLTCGDPQYRVGPHRIVLEGTTIVDDVETVANDFYTVNNQQVTLSDDYLTLVVGGAASGYSMINAIIISSSAPSSSFTPVQISFQPAAVPAPSSPWLVDSGAVHDEGQGYGWNADRTSQTRDREINSDQVKDTFIQCTSGNEYTWNFDVPNGMYFVSLSVGDAGYEQGPASVSVEDIYLVDGEITSANVFYEITGEIVNVFDGNITVKVGDADGHTMLNSVEITDVKPAVAFPLRLNLKPGFSAKASGYKSEIGAEYNANRGFGWEGAVKDARERSINPSPLLDTFVNTTWSGDQADWLVDVPSSGTYYVYVGCGDPQYLSPGHMVVAEPGTGNEVTLVNIVPTDPNEFVQVENQAVTLSDTQLELRLGDPSPSGGPTMLNYAIVDDTERQDWTIPIDLDFNFQPDYSSTPGGYVKDDGSLYDVTTMHGWISRPNGARERSGASEQRLLTFQSTDWSGSVRTWEVKIPNGTYNISLGCGDELYAAGPHRVIAEPGTGNEVTLVNDVATSAGSYQEIVDQSVTVSDDYLTIQIGGNPSGPTMLNYINIDTP